jgi:hypothetical protein
VVAQEKSVVAGNPDQGPYLNEPGRAPEPHHTHEHEAAHRPTNGFSKKIENLRAAVSVHFALHNFVRVHGALRITPAMAAGVSDRLWSLEELVDRTTN